MTVHAAPSFWETEGVGQKARGTVNQPKRSGGQIASLYVEWKILIQRPRCPVAMNLGRNFSSDIEIKTLLSLNRAVNEYFTRSVAEYFKHYSVTMWEMHTVEPSAVVLQVWSWHHQHLHHLGTRQQCTFSGSPG